MPRPNTPIVSPHMVGALPNFHPTTCTIERETITRDDAGGEITAWAPFLEDIPAVLAVRAIPGRTSSREDREPNITRARDDRIIQLQGYYPDVTNDDRALCDGFVFNILGVEHDSHHTFTSLNVEQVS